MAITRDEWSEQHDRCMVCNWTCGTWTLDGQRWLETHHIARGPARQAGLDVLANLLRLCDMCHDEMDGLRLWPIKRQLAIKKLKDPEHYDRIAVLKLRVGEKTWAIRPTPDAITEEEVDACL